MVERLFFKNLVTFDTVELEFDKGLVVFTGPSGAGKSVLMSTILSSFGYPTQGAANLCEVSLTKPKMLTNNDYALEDELTIKTLKKEKLRYLINGQNISKKALNMMFNPYVKYLSVRDKSGFESETLLAMIDNALLAKDSAFKKLKKEYTKRYHIYSQKQKELKKIEEDEAKLIELIEFTTYEVEKIEKINPIAGEDETLIQVKKQLSRIDKIKESLKTAIDIFACESAVEEVYKLLDKDATLFIDTMNQVRTDFEETEHLATELEEMNVEEILDRLSDITLLQQRYGSIEEAIDYKNKKKEELKGYLNIKEDKSLLESFLSMEYSELNILAKQISFIRKIEAKSLENTLKEYLTTLKLPPLEFIFDNIILGLIGLDSIEVMLGSSKTSTLSGGEFNRVRLALMVATLSKKQGQGVLILDEIDANVSGDESIAIAKMITKLSTVYQIFAISHQPHLSAQAQQHILVTKSGLLSEVTELNDEGKIYEIARIIAGENPTKEAMAFAKELRGSK